ncbi:MAG: hypothetical protein M3Y86_00180, partial [Verrucomicrobiota bacterium]|nr:hypothetical protein [Verrucomicrobiota bacterium]
MSAKRIRCECGRVYEPAKRATCPACGASPAAATITEPKPAREDDEQVLERDRADEEGDIRREDA